MLSKIRFQSLLKLSRKKDRLASQLFFVDGWRWLREAVATPGVLRHVIVVSDAARTEFQRDLLERARAEVGAIEEAHPDQVARLAGSVSPSGVVALVQWRSLAVSDLLATIRTSGPSLIGVLDGVSDPGNAGTIVRSSDWFGAHGVLFGSGSAEPSNPKVVRSTMGSLFHLPIAMSKPVTAGLSDLRQSGYAVIGATLDGDDATSFEWPERVALVIGNEAGGISAEVAATLDRRVSIPAFGRAESLNAAVAFSILAGEWRRRFRDDSEKIRVS